MTTRAKDFSLPPRHAPCKPTGTQFPQSNNAAYAPCIGGLPCVYPYAASPGTAPLVCGEHLTLYELVPSEESRWHPTKPPAS